VQVITGGGGGGGKKRASGVVLASSIDSVIISDNPQHSACANVCTAREKQTSISVSEQLERQTKLRWIVPTLS
jgi:hypothetical protein